MDPLGMNVQPLFATPHAPPAPPPCHHNHHHRQPDPMPPIGPMRVQVIGERVSGKHPENPYPDGSMQNAIVPLVAFPEDGSFHRYFSSIAAIARVTQTNAYSSSRPTLGAPYKRSLCGGFEVSLPRPEPPFRRRSAVEEPALLETRNFFTTLPAPPQSPHPAPAPPSANP